MTDPSKIKLSHAARCVYIRQSPTTQARSNITANPPPVSTPWPIGPVNWVGPKNKWSHR